MEDQKLSSEDLRPVGIDCFSINLKFEECGDYKYKDKMQKKKIIHLKVI